MGKVPGLRRSGKQQKTGPPGFLLMLTAAVLLAGSVLAVGCAGEAAPEAAEQMIKDITVLEASDLIEENRGNADFFIIDVRTSDEYNSGHIAGAEMVDFQADDFRDRIGEMDRGKTYLVHCRSGGRSAGARDVMEDLGFLNVYHMLGGILGWQEEGLSLVE